MEVVAKLPSADQRDSELKMVLKALGAFRRGESGVTLPTEWDGVYGKIAAEFNDLTAQTARTSHKLKALEGGSRRHGPAPAAARREAHRASGKPMWPSSTPSSTKSTCCRSTRAHSWPR